jgi:predicted phage terminase large subunit-like protein
MIADALLDSSHRGDIALDPFLGSGATLMAAERTGRRCFGLEIDPLYVDVIVRRWQAYTGDVARHLTTGATFDETETARKAVDENHVVETIFGQRRYSGRIGEALHPARESLETLKTIRDTIGTYNFAGQYQQTPAPAGGGLVREAWFRRYDPATLDKSFKQTVQSWDTANKPSQLADYSVCTTWGLRDNRFYLLNVYRHKLTYRDLKRAVREQDRLFMPTSILIEDKASGAQLILDLLEEGISKVVKIASEGDKIMRLHAQSGTIENGFVHVPMTAHWLADYLHELTVFPNGRYDDQVDSTAQALAWTKMRPLGWGWLEYARRENAKRNTGEGAGPMVRMLAPVGIGALQTFTGRRSPVTECAAQADRTQS